MIKTTILALFLSQALIQDVVGPAGVNGASPLQVFHGEPVKVEYINDVSPRRVHTQHIRRFTDRPVVVAADTWYTKKTPVPYWKLWIGANGQTAQQMAAIASVIAEGGEDIGWVLTGD